MWNKIKNFMYSNEILEKSHHILQQFWCWKGNLTTCITFPQTKDLDKSWKREKWEGGGGSSFYIFKLFFCLWGEGSDHGVALDFSDRVFLFVKLRTQSSYFFPPITIIRRKIKLLPECQALSKKFYNYKILNCWYNAKLTSVKKTSFHFHQF